ncbi:MAG: magnesium transporter [Bacteroidetes bacterium]|nr:magnesium transporter [Bacteroidota bacterium]
MTSLKTFYLSTIIGKRIVDLEGNLIGKICDFLIDLIPVSAVDNTVRAKVVGIKIKMGDRKFIISNIDIEMFKENSKFKIICPKIIELPANLERECILLCENILDKQIVDINGRKLVRVNDVRMASVSTGIYAVAVDVGMEGLLRRIGIAKSLKILLSIFKAKIPSEFILWDDVEAIDYNNLNIKLSMASSKLNTLHPSDIADIIEDLDKESRTKVFESLDDEKAADVLEELETHAQIHIIESLPVEKAADVLEKMPADEAADILEELEDDKVEKLLIEMESEASQEVRELMEYEENTVGTIMSTEFYAFNKTNTVAQVLKELKTDKPENENIYCLFVTNSQNELIATFTLRDLIVNEPDMILEQLMKVSPITLLDEDKIDSIAEVISKYNLLAVPVIDKDKKLQGMVVIDDIVEDLVNKGRTNKR